MDQLLRLNEETLKWHVLCQLLSSSVLERLLKTMCEVYPSFNADANLVARLYHETEQACLDVVRNFILIGEANKLLQNTGHNSPRQSTSPPGYLRNGLKTSPSSEPLQAMRRLAPKPNSISPQLVKHDNLGKGINHDESSLKSSLVNQINQNIQLQLKQLNQQNEAVSGAQQGSATPASPSNTPSNTQIQPETAHLLSAHLNSLHGKSQQNGNAGIQIKRESQSPSLPNGVGESNHTTANTASTAEATTNGVEPQQLERQVSELKNYMNEVKALFDVFNDPSPKAKEAVNALSQAISVNNAVAQGLSSIIKMETEAPQLTNAAAPVNYFPIQPQPMPPVEHYKKSSKEKLNCKDCGQMFQYTYQMERHIATRHSYIKKIICDICKKTFGSPGALKRHHETIHQKIKRFTCEDCGKKFGRKDHMKFHISTVHSQKKEQQVLEQSIIDAAITQAKQTVEKKRVGDPLDELKQRIRDMSENHAKEMKQQIHAQQHILQQQQLQQHLFQQQQQVDLASVLSSLNADFAKAVPATGSLSLASSAPGPTSITSSIMAPISTNGLSSTPNIVSPISNVLTPAAAALSSTSSMMATMPSLMGPISSFGGSMKPMPSLITTTSGSLLTPKPLSSVITSSTTTPKVTLVSDLLGFNLSQGNTTPDAEMRNDDEEDENVDIEGYPRSTVNTTMITTNTTHTSDDEKCHGDLTQRVTSSTAQYNSDVLKETTSVPQAPPAPHVTVT